MLSLVCGSVNEAFCLLAEQLHKNSDYTLNPRGLETREITPVHLKILNPYDRIVSHPARKISLAYFIGELLWYLRASDSLAEIQAYSSFWNQVSNDGITVNSSYGKHFFVKNSTGSNQWDYAKRALNSDSHTRRAVLIINQPEFLYDSNKDIPCTQFLQFTIRNNLLHLHCSMRSNDLIYGFTYDVACFTLLQELMLLELRSRFPDLRMGHYYHSTTSLHVYRKHYNMIEEISKNMSQEGHYLMPRVTNLEAVNDLINLENKLRLNINIPEIHSHDEWQSWAIKILIGHFSTKRKELASK